MSQPSEEELLRTVGLHTAQSIRVIRQRADEEILLAKQALETRSEELAHSLSVMRATLDSTADGILVVDDRGGVLDFNEQFVRLWSFSRDLLASSHRGPLLQRAATQVKNPEHFLVRTEEIYRDALPESTDVLEFRDGRVIERYSKLLGAENRVVGRVWSYRDITERVRAEETLRDEARLLELLNKTGTAIAAQLDLQNVVQIVTDAATELTDAKFGAFFYARRDEKEDTPMLYTVSGASPEAFEGFGEPRSAAIFGPTFEGEGPIRVDDVLEDERYGQMGAHFGMPKGNLPMRSFLSMPVVSSSGEVIGGLFFGHPEPGIFTARSERIIVGVAAQAAIAIGNARLYEAAQREIAERKRAEAEREKLLVSEKEARARAELETRMKDEFLATLSHELRTPLNAILGWANILRASERPEDLAEGVAVIERNARAQAQIIEDLLDMSRIISGKVRLDIQTVDLSSVITAAIESVSPMAAARKIVLETKLDSLASPISGDPSRLQQILWNLLTNAVKFTPRAGRVLIELERLESHVDVRVADNGQGISPEFLPSVFDRFRQADASTTRKHGGLGLGLAIVKNLVELHGGQVCAESAGLNQGATFTISLPVVAVIATTDAVKNQRPAVADAPMPAGCPDLSGLSILAVDDEADARQLVRRILSDCGAAVETVSSTAEAMAALRRKKPDLLITDIGMPGEDGYALMRQVRKLSAKDGGAVLSIALTAFARAEDRERAIASGFQVHVAKPTEASELLAVVASLTGRSETKIAQPEFNY